MQGRIRLMKPDKGFGFIHGNDNLDYFFHKSACNGAWNILQNHFDTGDPLIVSFDPEDSHKGPRAENVRHNES